MKSRRDFLKISSISGIGLWGLGFIPEKDFFKQDRTRLTILHTNDWHSHIDPFSLDDPKYPGLGGVARRASLIKKIRKEEENVLLLDAGDVFQGTPYFNVYKGELEFKLMSEMGYDASTMGNHDFDNGIEGFDQMLPYATFPFIISNYNFNDTPLHKKTICYKVFEKGGIKIGTFGLGVELKGLVDKRLYGNTLYENPVEKAAYYSHLLKNELKCDLVICLSHLGFSYKDEKMSDVILAKQSRNIDLVIGGHTHTFLEQPIVLKNRDGKPIVVSQAAWAGLKLGRIDFLFEKKACGAMKKNVFGNYISVDETSIRS